LTGTIDQLREQFNNESRSTVEKLSAVQVSIGKLEAPIAVNSQTITTLNERTTSMQGDMQKLGATIQSNQEQTEKRFVQTLAQIDEVRTG
jgi:hypothetical protein